MDSKMIDGDVAVSRNANIGGEAVIQGNVLVGHDLKVNGWLEAPNIRGAGKGMYGSADALAAAYPYPEEGWWALVGNTLPARLYVCHDGRWTDTGNEAGEVTVEFTQYGEEIDNLYDTMESMSEQLQRERTVLKHQLFPSFDVRELTIVRPGDITWVGQQLWTFSAGSQGGNICIYDEGLALVTASMGCLFNQTFLPENYPENVRLLAMTSVDYNKGMLLVGNGGNFLPSAYSRAFIFYDLESWADVPDAIRFTNCGDYKMLDLSALGGNCITAWAGGADNDQIMVVTNDLMDVYQVQLGLGSVRLEQGDFATATARRHNGSYHVVKHWHQGRTGQLTPTGAQMHRGQLYLSTSNVNASEVYRCNLHDNGELTFDVVKLERRGAERAGYNSGTTALRNCYVHGVCLRGDKLYAKTLHNSSGSLLIAEV